MLEQKSWEWAEDELIETEEGSEKASCSNRVFSVYERCGDSVHSGVVKIVPYSAEVRNG